ncbi:MAG TPA: hypothetical protein VF476_01450 [Chitinophagaceae bacterium]
MKKAICFLSLIFVLSPSFAQEENDSLKILGEVTIRAFEQHRKQNTTTAAVKLLSGNASDRYNKSSLVNSFNSIAGV